MNHSVIRTSYNVNEPIQSLTLNNTQEFITIITRTQIITYQLLPEIQQLQQFHLLSESGNNFKMTDVSWNLFDSDKIAASATNGSVVVFNLNMKGSKQSKQEWDNGELTRAVNCIGWSPFDRYQLFSAHQDGHVKLWDTRQKAPCLKILNGPNDSCRDAQFDPFHQNILASIYENGTLMIWDRRNSDHPIYRFSAHSDGGLVVEWNPNKEWIIATGSRDKSVKIWDIGGVDDNNNININDGINNTSTLTTLNNNNNNNNSMNSANLSRPIHVVHTPAALGSISWRPAESESSRRCYQLATTSSSESGRGDISIWDISIPNIPACILRGHTDGCSGFQWLDTPPFGSNIYQHIISVGKDNKILVQDVRNSYFPSQHISRHVVALSAIGHVAFQRGDVDRSDPLGLVFNEITSHAPSYFSDDPNNFGIPLQFTTESLVTTISSTDNTTINSNLNGIQSNVGNNKFDSGEIYVGMGNISKIMKSIECLSGYSAEGGAYDPIVVRELAKQYKYFQPNTIIKSQSQLQSQSHNQNHIQNQNQFYYDPSSSHHSEHSIWGYESFFLSLDYESNSNNVHELVELFSLENQVTQSVREAINACKWNSNIAESVGLAGHSKIWTALMSLIPAAAITFDVDPLKSNTVGFSSSLPLSCCSFNYVVETLCDLLIELIDTGDCQHFVICCEVLRHIDQSNLKSQPSSSLSTTTTTTTTTNHNNETLWKKIVATIKPLRVREGYMAYLELLSRLELHQIANSIILQSTDSYISQLSQQGIIMRSSCAQCGKELNIDNLSSSSSLIASIWCVKCQRCVDLCHLCQQPVKGLLNWCQVCGHGGHPNCVKKWFEKYEMCPSGCGHKCVSHEQKKGNLNNQQQQPQQPSLHSQHSHQHNHNHNHSHSHQHNQ